MTCIRSYNSINKCIYCRSQHYRDVSEGPPERLGDEHILPMSLGGTLMLPNASCQDCERITSGLESHCVNGLYAASRPHLKVRGRGKDPGRRRTIATPLANEQRRVKILKENHPGILLGLHFPPPALLFGMPHSPWIGGQTVIKHILADFDRRVRSAWPDQVSLGEIETSTFARMLAKIAHAFSVAELGLDGFHPVLGPVILGDVTYLGDLVGSAIDERPAEPFLHTLKLEQITNPQGLALLVASVRLFAEHAMPTYRIVAGALNPKARERDGCLAEWPGT